MAAVETEDTNRQLERFIDGEIDALADELGVDFSQEDYQRIGELAIGLADEEGAPDVWTAYANLAGEIDLPPLDDSEDSAEEAGFEEEFEHDEIFEVEGHEVRGRIADLESRLLGPSDAQIAVTNRKLEKLEEQHGGVKLSAEEFDRAGQLTEQGISVEDAFELVADEHQQRVEAWESEFEHGLKAKESELNRRVTQVEKDKLLNWFADDDDGAPDEFVPDVAAAWEALYGERFTDEQVAEAETAHKNEMERLRQEGYSEEFVAKYDEENRPELNKHVAEMRRSGKGDFDLDSEEGRTAYIEQQFAGEAPPAKPLSEDPSPQERADYIDQKLSAPAEEAEHQESALPPDASSAEVTEFIDNALAGQETSA